MNDEQQAKNKKKPMATDTGKMQGETRRRTAFISAEKKYLADNPPDPRKKKSGPKAAGVKSLFQLKEGEMLMTSFGRGNDAIQEKAVHSGVIENLQEKPAFSAETEKKGYVVSGRMTHGAVLDDPSQSTKAPGDDLIGLRRKFEELYFGTTFEDNIHIQLIYNILDIEKILTIHINNIIYEINNLFRRDGDDYADLFQSLRASKPFENLALDEQNDMSRSASKELFEELMNTRRRAYFGDILYKEPKRNKDHEPEAMDLTEKKHYYYVLALLATTRHSLAHGKSSDTSVIYQLDGGKNVVSPEALMTLDALYKKKISAINKDFIEKARQKNLPLLFEALHVTDRKRKEQLARDYYDFTVRKEYKNQGFSIKTIRELILSLPDARVLTEQQYDSVRSKLYMLFDFVIFDWYRNHPKRMDELVNNLRGALTEEDKLHYYIEAVEFLWGYIRPAIMDYIAVKLNRRNVKDILPVPMDEHVLDGVLLQKDASRFSKLMYLLTCFQDGKEINDLLTTLINKFENIASFQQVLQERGLSCDFQKEYRMFANSQTIAKELRTINAFARMSKADTATKAAMFYDAAYLLGFNGSDEELTKLITTMLDKDSGALLPGGKKDNSFRNFIINNVIESRRFQYLARYGNPKKLCKLVRNKKVVAFVLKDIPDAQIVRYYNSCKGVKAAYNPNMRKELQGMIAQVDFTDFELIRTNARYATPAENAEKERKKAIVRLYLTVLYLLVKNLVYINSRYFLAFHCVERDAVTYDSEKYASLGREKLRLRDFAIERVEQGTLNKRATHYMQQNFANSDPMFIVEFRNHVDHMNAVRNADKYINDIAKVDSYFELYHYILQRSLIDTYHTAVANGWLKQDVNPKSLEYIALVEKYHAYCKDMVKALNVPFAYNLPRYKNLSIKELFDQNNYLPKEAGKDAIKSE